MSRPTYQRASSTNLRPGTAPGALEGKLAIVSVLSRTIFYPFDTIVQIVGRVSGAERVSCCPNLLCCVSCLPLKNHIESPLYRLQERLEVRLQNPTVPRFELRRISKGIGAAIAQNLASKGSSLVIGYTSDSSSEPSAQLAASLMSSHGVNAIAVQADMGHPQGPAHLISTAKTHFAHPR